ncbi:Transposon Tf2-6 polyprotein [Thelohanellus kitauei]|uniref:Transposon Tf2-6 polyprotein n=1 Tax=Thelohanellus kitauei TaxID=669202 RepID=A0A0C2J667_THEKT|nr:Transposon Tf2-6 polyprotein [Thelohanellus kitauei]
MLCTDHMPLVSLFGGRKGVPLTASARIYRWAIFLSGFTFTVKHKKGIDNAPADAFSRLPIKDEAVGKVSSVDRAIVKHLENLIDPNSILSLDYETENDEILRQVREMHLRNWRFYKKSPELDPYYKLRDELSLMGKLIIMREKIVVPVAARSYLLKRLHEGHLGFTKTKSLARQCIWWPSIDEDIMRLIENCPICSLHKRKQPPQVSIKPWVKMTSPLERVYIDFVGPLANKMIFVLVDDFSKWPEAMVMDTTTAEDTIQVLDEIFSRIGVPREIVSDNGPQFISKTFSDYLQGEGIIHTRSPPYHPSTNGTAERFVQTLKGSIGNCRGDKLRWQVSKFLKSYRNSEHCTTNRSPTELLICRKIRTFFDNLKPATQLTRNESFTCRSLNIGDTVLVRFYRSTGGKLEQGTVTDILGDRNYILYANGQYHHRHIDQLIPYLRPIESFVTTNSSTFVKMSENRRKSLSNEMKKMIFKMVVLEGQQVASVSRILDIPRTTIHTALKKIQPDGTIVESRRGGTTVTKLTPEIERQITQLINDNCTMTTSDIIEKIGITVNETTVWRWLKKLNFSWKMTRPVAVLRNDPTVKSERKSFVEWYQSMTPEYQRNNIIYIDESPFNLQMFRSHGWALVGETPNPVIPTSRGPNVSMILALNSVNIVHCEAIVGRGVNSTILNEFLTKIRETLGTEQIYTIVMDNVRFHHSNPEFYDEYPYEIKYLPRYSPFLNPCEEAFSLIKNQVRRDSRPTGANDLIQRMRSACATVTGDQLLGFIQHSESFKNMCLNEEDIPRN